MNEFETEKVIAEASDPVASENKENKPYKAKSHHILCILLFGTLSILGGFGGGYLAGRLNHGTAIVYRDASPTQTISNVAESGSLQEVISNTAPSVVEILTESTSEQRGLFGGSYISSSAGSGVIISDDGYIVTNNHVVNGAQKITVTLNDGKDLEATLIGTDAKSDIAVIKVESSGLTPAIIGNSDQLKVGDIAIAIGNPLGELGGTVTNGIVSAINREININHETMNLIQTNAAINSGNSGGGLFDANGRLIGIVNAKDSGFSSSGATIEGLGFAIPINDAMEVAQQLMKDGYVTNRATLGVQLTVLEQDRFNYKAGLYIADVLKGSGAEQAGLQAYDRIIAIDGKEVSTYPELSKILKDKSVGDTVEITVIREGEQKNFSVTLTGPMNPNS